jgi:hypothetical protein
MPRIQQGQLFYVTDYLITNAYNAEQTVNVLGAPISGTWTLAFGGQITNPPLAWDATPSQVQTALEALSTIGAGNVIVTADVEPFAFDVEFTGTLGDQQIPVLIGNADLLVNDEGEGFCEITVAPTALGSPQVTADTAIAIPTLQARIWDGVLSTIDRVDTAGFQLLSNTAILNIGGPLHYDISFTQVTYNGVGQTIAPFGITASADDTAQCLTDPNADLIAYVPPSQPPYTQTWSPPGTTPLNVVYARPGPRGLRDAQSTWRERRIG